MANGDPPPVEMYDDEGRLFAVKAPGDVPAGTNVVGVEDPFALQSREVDMTVPEAAPVEEAPLDPNNMTPLQLAEMGLVREKRVAGRAPGMRLESVSDWYEEREGAPEKRAEMRDRGEAIQREVGQVDLAEAQGQRDWLDQRMQAQQMDMYAKQREVQETEGRYRNERAALDQAMGRQRELASKGFGMDRIMGTPAGAFGMLLASAGMAVAAGGGAKTARNTMDLYDRQVKNIIKGQEMEWQASQGQVDNAYQKLLHTYNDRGQARSALEIMLNDQMKMELERLALQHADPRIKANVEQRILELDQKHEALEEEFHMRSIGKRKKKFDKGVAGKAGGIRRMTLKETTDYMKNKANLATAEAKLAKETGAANPEMQRLEYEQAALKGTGDAAKNWGSISASQDMLGEVIKSMGGGGLDEDGNPILPEYEFFGDTLKGVGPMAPIERFFGDATALEVEKMMDQAQSALMLARSGQAVSEPEYKRIRAMIRSDREDRQIAGLKSLAKSLQTSKSGLKSQLRKHGTAVMEQRDAELAAERGQTASPSSLGATKRGG